MDTSDDELDRELIDRVRDRVVDEARDRFIDEKNGQPAQGEKDRDRLKEIIKEIVDDN